MKLIFGNLILLGRIELALKVFERIVERVRGTEEQEWEAVAQDVKTRNAVTS